MKKVFEKSGTLNVFKLNIKVLRNENRDDFTEKPIKKEGFLLY